MIIDKAALILALLLSYFIQSSVDFFKLGEIKPDFLLILTLYYSIYKGEFSALWIGFWGGILQDINLGGIDITETGKAKYFLGTHALPKTIIGYTAGKLSKGINKDSNFVIFIIIFFASIIKGLIIFFLVAVFHGNIAAKALITIALPEALYNSVLGIFWFKLLRWALPQVENEKTSN
ncbi:MAG: rod shape-determining protein MreD [Spirochaetia bacterium]|nr:rod shape-determining protein MreD [Spirochaetia bacterium]